MNLFWGYDASSNSFRRCYRNSSLHACPGLVDGGMSPSCQPGEVRAF